MDLFVFESFGPLAVRWYGLLFAGSFVVGYQIGAKHFREAGFTQKQIDSLLTYMIVAVVAGARLGHCLFYDPVYYLSNPLEILMIWKGGLASHGAAIGVLIAMVLFAQKNKPFTLWMIADRLMIPVAIGTAFIRLGNFFNSEIIGEPSTLPWAVVFEAEDMLPRHPTMLYESFSYMIMVGILLYMYKAFDKKPPEGLMFGVFLIYMFTARFIIEISKTSQAAYQEVLMSTGQWLSIPFILMGIWVLVTIGLKNYKAQKKSV
ncbi:prolipoprotein diacylglyceryl transferase [bacterium]|nr:MAG: prolipoprotein diacylglyceryl transferase [bacterium]